MLKTIIDCFISKELLYLIYLAGIMIVTGIVKEYDLFSNLYSFLIRKIKSKRLLISLISAISGILPIPGRVVVSAGILDVLSSNNNKKRQKFGIVDYLSTHHYYLWSPLEPTIALLISGLSLTYVQVLTYTWPLLLISLLYLFYYIFVGLKEDDIELQTTKTKISGLNILRNVTPIPLAIVLMICKTEPYIVFPIIAIYYIILEKVFNLKKLFNYVKWNLILTMFVVLVISNFIKSYNVQILSAIDYFTQNLNIHTFHGFLILSIVSFTCSFIFGSSSKFAGIVVILTNIVGVEFLTYLFALEFCGYLLSPTHKCVLTGSGYFGTPLKEYYKVIGLWCIIMIVYAITTILI